MNKHPDVTGLSAPDRESDDVHPAGSVIAQTGASGCPTDPARPEPSCQPPEENFEPLDELDELDELSGDSDGAPVGDRVLTCFRCNRPDFHFHGLRPRWYWSLLLGFSFGLVQLIGPYRCRCCGARRWMCWDLANPRCWMKWINPVRYGSGFGGIRGGEEG